MDRPVTSNTKNFMLNLSILMAISSGNVQVMDNGADVFSCYRRLASTPGPDVVLKRPYID
jgi:hypothetical protein